jgi:hypothetical protein
VGHIPIVKKSAGGWIKDCRVPPRRIFRWRPSNEDWTHGILIAPVSDAPEC